MTSRAAIVEFEGDKIYMTGKLLLTDTPNANGITYTRECVETALAKYNEKNVPIYGTLSNTKIGEFMPSVKLAEVATQTVSTTMTDEGLEARVVILDTPRGKLLSNIIKQAPHTSLGFNTSCIGEVKEGIVTEATLIGFSVVEANKLV